MADDSIIVALWAYLAIYYMYFHLLFGVNPKKSIRTYVIITIMGGSFLFFLFLLFIYVLYIVGFAFLTTRPVAVVVSAAAGWVIYNFCFKFSSRRLVGGRSHTPLNTRDRCRNIFDHLRGTALDESKTELVWGWTEDPVVGLNHHFDILMYRSNGKPYNLNQEGSDSRQEQELLVGADSEVHNSDPLSIRTLPGASLPDSARLSGVSINVLIEFEGSGEHVNFVEEVNPEGLLHAVRYSFRPHKAGSYGIIVVVNQYRHPASPFVHWFYPGDVSASNVRRKDDCSVVVAEANNSEISFQVELRDRFDNVCSNYEAAPMQMDVEFSIAVQDADATKTTEPFRPVFYVSKSSSPGCCELNVALPRASCYTATVSFQNEIIQNGLFQIIFLSDEEKKRLKEINNSSKLNVTYFRANLLPSKLIQSNALTSSTGDTGGVSTSSKSQDVYCYFSGKHLVVAKYKYLIFKKTVASFRLVPLTKIEFSKPPQIQQSQRSSSKSFMQVGDGIQIPVQMFCQDRNVLTALFVQKMLKNIGGSESFSDKRKFLKEKLEAQYGRNERNTGNSTTYAFSVKRSKLVESSMSALAKKDVWGKLFVVSFHGEEGQDCGGLRREWLSLLCSELFDPKSGLFRRLSPDDSNSPLHPVSGVPKSSYKLLEFAGRVLAKSLLESTVAPQASQASMPFRLSRSLIAQLIGLRVNISHLEIDDPDLYRQKVQYIFENDVTDLEMTFTEEEYDPTKTPSTTVHNLIPNGANIAVTNENKKFYLDQLVQFKLVSSTKAELEEFRKGFESVVSSDLLMMFSENEVELMLCGASLISVVDFQAHSLWLNHSTAKFSTVMKWFWTLVESMTQEEMALLLQFITGSCRLPVGGFKDLEPHIEIRQHSGHHDTLPVAQTCFNRLLLPIYSSYQTMQKLVLLALNEGSTGFALS